MKRNFDTIMPYDKNVTFFLNILMPQNLIFAKKGCCIFTVEITYNLISACMNLSSCM